MLTTHVLVRPRATIVLLIMIAALSGCTRDPAVHTGGTPSPMSGAAAAADTNDLGAPVYAVCRGQGGNREQLAPAFLDQMQSCAPADTAPADTLAALGGNGKLVEGTGDCQFGNGISCHFHTSMEFVTPDRRKDDAHGVGEMHCIAPSAHSNSPTVYGARLRCKPGTTPASGTHTCSAALLQLLGRNQCHDGWRCCDNGTLTEPISKQAPAELKLRPDFRICQDDALEVDCGLFHDMRGHTANVAGVGEAFNGTFNIDVRNAMAH